MYHSIHSPRHWGAAARLVVRRTTLAVLAALVTACASQPAVYESLGEVVDEPQYLSATIAELAADPEEFAGKVVTVAGEVNRVLGPRWFTIGGEEFGGHEILVLGRSTVPALLSDLADSARIMNDIVQVTGVVRVFEEDALEREIGSIDLDGDVFDFFDAEPVIVMAELDITPRSDPVTAMGVPVPALVPVLRDVEIFVPDRSVLAGRSAALFDVRVDSILGPRTFSIGRSDAERLIVVLNDSATVGGLAGQAGTTSLHAGQRIFVAGVLRRVPMDLAELRRQRGLEPAGEAALREQTIYLDALRVEMLDGNTAR